MKNKYENVFADYVLAHSISPHNYEEHLKEYGYMRFFNYITESCLGTSKVQYKNTPKTSSSLIYLPDIAKEKYIDDVDIICISNLYPGIITNGNIEFNYPTYGEFVAKLFKIRDELVTKEDDLNFTKQTLIKKYTGMVYGAIDNSGSVLSCKKDNMREYVVNQAKHVMLNVSAFFLNKSIPMFYIDTDEVFIPKMDKKMFKEFLEHYMETCGDIINTDVSSPFLSRFDGDNRNDSQFVIFSNKKKYVFGNISTVKKTKGIPSVDCQKVLNQNKKYFGRNFFEIFPEYAI